MKRWMIVVAVVIASAGATLIARQTPGEEQRQALRTQIEARFNVVPVTEGIALTPKTRMPDVRLIEITDAGIAINGAAVTGRELRDRVGSDADAILRLSYLDAETRRALFSETPAASQPSREQPIERPSTSPPPTTTTEERRGRRQTGDRVRIFGDVNVASDEAVEGAAIAVLGSVRIDGEVGREAVAVLGSVTLGPNAVVHGDAVSVGGRVRRDSTARVRGSVTEVALDGIHAPDVDWRWGPPVPFYGFGAVPRLIGSGFRLLLLLLLTGLTLLLARATVEAAAQRLGDDAIKSTIVGVASEILIPPTLVICAILLAISIIGIPVLFLMTPFVLLFLIVLGLLGFTGAALAVGGWMRRRLGFATQPGFSDVVIGVIVILLPLLIGRLIAVAGWPVSGISLLLIVIGIAVEFFAWTAGFGAVITNAFSRWQARRAMRAAVQPTPPVTS